MRSGEATIPLGPFTLHEPIGRGGMCEVWRGIHRESGVPIALKVILHQYAQTPSYVRAFRDEVRAVAGLHHNNIVMVFDFGQIPEAAADASGGRLQAGSPFMAMELAQGVLTPLCGKLTWPQVSWLLFALLDGLAHAHARGVVHRDLKPGNILLVDSSSRVKVTDFGLAHLLDRGTTPSRFQMLKGTPAYMAPEQFAGHWRDYGPWTDLYALGCCAYAMVCGRSPYGPQADFFAYKEAHLTHELPPFPKELRVPKGLWDWLQRLMQRDPDARFQRAADAAWALRGFCTDESIGSEDTAERAASAAAQAHPTEANVHVPWAVASPAPTPHSGTFAWGEASLQGLSIELSDHLPTQGEMVWQLVDAGEATVTEQGELGDPDTVSLGRQPLLFPTTTPPDAAPKFAAPPPLPTLWAEHDARRIPARQLYNVGLGLFGLRTVPLVAREEEREQLWQLLHEVQHRRVLRAIRLEGTSGCGKSRLAEWFCERAHEVGVATVLQAHHNPLPGTTDGLAPMLRRHFRVMGLSRKDVQQRLAARLPREGITQPGAWQALTNLLAPLEGDSLRDPLQREGHSTEAEIPLLRFGTAGERHRLISQTIDGFSQERAVLLWLDDVQWGVETLAFVQALLQPSEDGVEGRDSGGVLVIMTTQTEALAKRPEAARLLHEIEALPGSQTIELPPLAEAAQLQLIQTLLGVEASLATRLCDHTKGNPLFAVQMLGDWVQGGRLLPSPDGFCLKSAEDLTRAKDLHQVWLRRITQILEGRPEDDKVALELAAALGHEVNAREWEVACESAGVAPPHDLVDLLLAQRLARRDHERIDNHWAFVHVLLRESLARQAREEGRWASHHRVCAGILDPPQDRYQRERMGRHLLVANDPKAALPVLLQAVRELIQTGDFTPAAGLLDELETILERRYAQKVHPLWGELWLLHCQLSRAHGDYESAGKWALLTSKHARAEGWEQILGRALIEEGIWGWRTNEDVDGAAACFQEAHSFACTQRDRKLQATSQRFLGALWGWRGEWERAKPRLLQALDAFVAVGDLIGISQCLLDLAEAERQSGRLTQATDYAQRAMHHLASYGNRRGIAGCFNVLGDIARLRGDLQQAEQHYRDSQELNHAIGSGRSSISTLNIGLVLVDRGHYQEARVILANALKAFGKRGLKGVEGFAHACLLPCAADDEDWDAWEEHFTQAQALLLEPGSIDVDVAQLIQHAADIALAKEANTQAKQAYLFSLHVWQAIGNDEAIAEIDGVLAGLVEEAVPLS